MDGPPAKNWTWIEYGNLDKLLHITPAACRVYLALLRHANKHRKCWPGQKRLIELLHIDKRTLWRALKELEMAKMISIEKGEKSTNIYTLPPPSSDDATTPTETKNHTGDDAATPSLVTPQHLAPMAPQHPEVDVNLTIDIEEGNDLTIFLKNIKPRYEYTKGKLLENIPCRETGDMELIAKIAALKVSGEFSENDFIEAMEFDKTKTKKTPVKHFLGILRQKARAVGKNLDKILAETKLPKEMS